MERLKRIGSLPRRSSGEIASSRIGIGFEKLDRGVFDPEKAYDKVAEAGAKYARIQSGWARTEREEGVYDFSWLDTVVDNLISRGIQPWMCLCYGNPVYTELARKVFGAVGCVPNSTEREMAAWLSYVRATVEHYKGRVALFEIWNEPDCFYAWRHREGEERTPERHLANAVEYGLFATETAIAIKEANPSAEVIGFAFGHVDDLEWARLALSTGLWRHIDLASFHCYSPDENKRRERAIGFKSLLASFDPKIRLVQGETGAQSRSDGKGAMAGFAWTPERQTKALLRGLVTDLAVGVEFTSYFSTTDMIEALGGVVGDKKSYLDYGYFGILGCEFDEDGIASGEYYEKPSYTAYASLVSLLHGAEHIPLAYEKLPLESLRVNGNDCTADTVRAECFALRDGKRALVYWNSVDLLTSSYEGTLSLDISAAMGESPTLVSLAYGGVYELPRDMARATGDGSFRLLHLPLTDSPLAIIFG